MLSPRRRRKWRLRSHLASLDWCGQAAAVASPYSVRCHTQLSCCRHTVLQKTCLYIWRNLFTSQCPYGTTPFAFWCGVVVCVAADLGLWPGPPQSAHHHLYVLHRSRGKPLSRWCGSPDPAPVLHDGADTCIGCWSLSVESRGVLLWSASRLGADGVRVRFPEAPCAHLLADAPSV